MVKIVWMVNIPKMVNKPIWSRLLDSQDEDAQVGQVCEDGHDCHWSISSSMPGSNMTLKNLATRLATLIMMMILKNLATMRAAMMMMAYRHIPTMTDSHHGGFLSVMIMVGICQVTKSHH